MEYTILALLVIGLALWILSQFPQIDATIAKIIRVVLIVVAVWIAATFLLSFLPTSGQEQHFNFGRHWR